MKITKRQLKRIIREEKSKVLKEYRGGGRGSAGPIHDGLQTLLDEVVATLSVAELENIAKTHTGSDFDDATRSLAKIALANIASDSSAYRGG